MNHDLSDCATHWISFVIQVLPKHNVPYNWTPMTLMRSSVYLMVLTVYI